MWWEDTHKMIHRWRFHAYKKMQYEEKLLEMLEGTGVTLDLKVFHGFCPYRDPKIEQSGA